MEKSLKNYYLFLFFSSFARGLVSVFSLVLLFQKGYSVSLILFFLFLLYFCGILVNIVSLLLPYRLVLLFSSFFYWICYFYLSIMEGNIFSLVLFSILFAVSNYSYHAVRHYLALSSFGAGKLKTNHLVCLMFLGTIISSLLGTFLVSKLPLMVSGIFVFFLSILGILPVFSKLDFWKDSGVEKKFDFMGLKIGGAKVGFSIFEQFKVIFLEVQPLFLYLYVKNSILYVGIFYLVVHLASLGVIYFWGNHIRRRYFLGCCLGLGFLFFLKIHLRNEIWLYVLALFEGIFVKYYENVSLDNLYAVGDNAVGSYLMVEEVIFFVTKSVVMGIFLLFHTSLYWVLMVCLIGTVISGFFLHEKKAG